MTTKFFALLTNQGAAKLANAAALGTKVQITQMGVGDGAGVLPTPNPVQTTLIAEKRRAALNALSVDAANSNQIIAEQIIPENEGGFWIREVGLYDSDDTLIAVANCPETYKPQLAEGSGRTQTVRMILIINSTDAVTLKIDPSVVLATRQYVDDKVIEVKAYTDGKLKTHSEALNPHAQYLQIARLLAEVKELGAASVNQLLVNLGLGEGSAVPVGVPLAFPLSSPPEGWLKCNGASFSAATYPKLAQIFPSLKLPDLRGEFLRGWDDGRGADAGRALLSSQSDAIRNITGSSFTVVGGTGTVSLGTVSASGALAQATTGNMGVVPVSSVTANAPIGISLDASRSVPTASENRPRNVAFNYIVRAA